MLNPKAAPITADALESAPQSQSSGANSSADVPIRTLLQANENSPRPFYGRCDGSDKKKMPRSRP
jgi:hypothetical protein